MNTTLPTLYANHIGHWSEGPETFVIVKARDAALGAKTYQFRVSDEDISKAARELCNRAAKECGVDKDDYWKCYGDGFIEDARATLAVIGLVNTQ